MRLSSSRTRCNQYDAAGALAYTQRCNDVTGCNVIHAVQDWLSATCLAYGWSRDLQSPVIWRELVQCSGGGGGGGKRLLIGGANEFRDYASAYYDVRSSLASQHLLQVEKCSFWPLLRVLQIAVII